MAFVNAAARAVVITIVGAIASFAGVTSLAGPAAARAEPAWLHLRPGTFARVDSAPWLSSDEPEAALAASASSMMRDFTSDATRPPDIILQPIGTRVRVVRVMPGGTVALVRGTTDRFEAYARIDRLQPEVPVGTRLVAAGGFEGYSDFFPTLATLQHQAGRLATRSPMVVLGMAAAAYDPDSADLVRVHVRVTGGALAGREGWVPVSYTGLPADAAALHSQPEKTCLCRVVTFDDRF